MAAGIGAAQKRTRQLSDKSRSRKRAAAPPIRPGMRPLDETLSKVVDPRRELGQRHRPADILIVALPAAVCGGDNWVEIAAYGRSKAAGPGKFPKLPSGIPSHDTFGGVFNAPDADSPSACYTGWMGGCASRTGAAD